MEDKEAQPLSTDHSSCGPVCQENRYDAVILHTRQDYRRAHDVKTRAKMMPLKKVAGEVSLKIKLWQDIPSHTDVHAIEEVCKLTKTVIILYTSAFEDDSQSRSRAEVLWSQAKERGIHLLPLLDGFDKRQKLPTYPPVHQGSPLHLELEDPFFQKSLVRRLSQSLARRLQSDEKRRQCKRGCVAVPANTSAASANISTEKDEINNAPTPCEPSEEQLHYEKAADVMSESLARIEDKTRDSFHPMATSTMKETERPSPVPLHNQAWDTGKWLDAGAEVTKLIKIKRDKIIDEDVAKRFKEALDMCGDMSVASSSGYVSVVHTQDQTLSHTEQAAPRQDQSHTEQAAVRQDQSHTEQAAVRQDQSHTEQAAVRQDQSHTEQAAPRQDQSHTEQAAPRQDQPHTEQAELRQDQPHTEHAAPRQDQSHTEQAAPRQDQTLSHTEHAAPRQDQTLSHTEHAAPRQDQTLSHTEHAAPRKDEGKALSADTTTKGQLGRDPSYHSDITSRKSRMDADESDNTDTQLKTGERSESLKFGSEGPTHSTPSDIAGPRSGQPSREDRTTESMEAGQPLQTVHQAGGIPTPHALTDHASGTICYYIRRASNVNINYGTAKGSTDDHAHFKNFSSTRYVCHTSSGVC